MTNQFYAAEAENHFSKVLIKGRRLVSKTSFVFIGNHSILSLSELINIARPDSEAYKGESDIPVYKVIGSEDRSHDFAEGFLPTRPWMQKRWTKVCQLMMEGELEEPIDVLEYGGVYFVRDGNHRVSVAKRLKREFIRARVTKLKIPYTLSENMTRITLPQFRKQVEFQKKTGFFTSVPDARFDMKRNSSWEILEKEMDCWSPAWFERHKEDNKAAEPADQYRIWYYWLEKTVISTIKKQSLHYLYPGWGDMDVAMEIIELWNTYPDPDEISIEELYRAFISRTRKKRFFLMPLYLVFDKINYLSRTACDERCYFYERSYISRIRPEFKLPSDLGKRFWRKLYIDLFHTHYQKMKKHLGRSPYHSELITDWYDNVWLPRTEY